MREIVLPPPVARVPLSPKPLLGLANLRGAVLPVASLRLLLGQSAGAASAPSERVVVLEGRTAFGLLVDEVTSLMPVPAAQISAAEAHVSADGEELLRGAFPVSGATNVAKILDIQALIAKSIGAVVKAAPAAAAVQQREIRAAQVVAEDLETFITFEIAGQEFGLPLESVREVLPTADIAAPVPRAETVVLGLTGLRNTLLPLLSLRALLGFGPSANGRSMTLVANIGGAVVGLAVDAVRNIVRVEHDSLEPVPAAIATRTQGEAVLQSVIKIDGGARLIAILSPDKLFREDVMNRIKASGLTQSTAAPASAKVAERTFLVFTLGGQEFGLAVSSVEEVARVSDEITRLPKSPDFLKGVVNLRGIVLPVIDQRRRFDFAPDEGGEGRRLVVVRIGASIAGFIVDSVREVLRVPSTSIDPPPEMVAQARMLEGVINLAGSERMILLLDPSQLLNKTEQALLDAVGGTQEAQAAVDQDSGR